MSTPNPGSDDAINQGCTCPVIDNRHGKGIDDPQAAKSPLFWITMGCPLHDDFAQEEAK